MHQGLRSVLVRRGMVHPQSDSHAEMRKAHGGERHALWHFLRAGQLRNCTAT